MLLLALLACGEAAPSGGPDSADDTGDAAADSGAPGDPGETWDCTPDPTVTWGGFADGFFATYCRSCHSADTPDRRGAPEGVDFDTRAATLAWSGRVRARVLDDGTMPLGGGVIDDDLVLLEGWLCAQAGR